MLLPATSTHLHCVNEFKKRWSGHNLGKNMKDCERCTDESRTKTNMMLKYIFDAN